MIRTGKKGKEKQERAFGAGVCVGISICPSKNTWRERNERFLEQTSAWANQQKRKKEGRKSTDKSRGTKGMPFPLPKNGK
jgi:hypothetical protein